MNNKPLDSLINHQVRCHQYQQIVCVDDIMVVHLQVWWAIRAAGSSGDRLQRAAEGHPTEHGIHAEGRHPHTGTIYLSHIFSVSLAQVSPTRI